MKPPRISTIKVRRLTQARGIFDAIALAREAEVPLTVAMSVFSTLDRMNMTQIYFDKLCAFFGVNGDEIRYVPLPPGGDGRYEKLARSRKQFVAAQFKRGVP